MSEKQHHVLPEEGVSLKQSIYEDEALEAVWEMRERGGDATVAALLEEVNKPERFDRMVRGGLIAVEDGLVVLTAQGEARARDITRRHRLAERLFADVLDIKDFEADACRIEHAISPTVEEAICTMLGHPPTCPHGNPIPKGKCCAVYARKIKPLVQSLREAEVGALAAVQFITGPAMHRLGTMGLVPGAVVRLRQKRPSFVLEIDETTIAVDEDIASGVYVKCL